MSPGTTRTRIRGLAAASLLVATVAALSLAAAPTEAASVSDAGWWQRPAGVAVGRPAPPPEGAIRVARDATGDLAVAAVRFQLEPDESAPLLVLRVTGAPADEAVVVVACPTSTSWTGEEGGDIAEAPEADCSSTTAGRVAADGTTISFDLSRTFDRPGETVDVVLQPAESGGDAVTGFAVDFAAPAGEDLRTRSAPSTTAPSAPPATSPPTTAAPTSPAPTVAAPPTTSFVPSDLGAPDPAPAPTTTAPATPAPPVTVAPIGDEVALDAQPTASEPRTRARGFALAIAAALVGGAAWWRTRLDGTVEEAGVAGLGRFARVRDDEPTPIS